MRKSDKKTENQIRLFLTDICEDFMKDFDGFLWLTHEVDYDRFPQSLMVTFVFADRSHLDQFLRSDAHGQLVAMLEAGLQKRQVKLRQIRDHLVYVVEQ